MWMFPLFAIAQDNVRQQAATDFRAVNKAYLGATALQLNVNYTLFPSYTSVVPFEKSNGVYMKQGSNTYSNLLGIITLTNSKAVVTLDSNERTIVVADAPAQSQQGPSLVNLDTLLGTCTSIEYKVLPEGMKYYKLHFGRVPVFEYNAIEVYIDPKTNFLSRITMFFRMEIDLDDRDDVYTKEKPRLEIVYTNVNTHPVFAQDQFSEAKFISMRGRLVTAAAAYTSYRVINNKIR